MGLGHSPSIPSSGIKIFYDVGNSKSYTGTGSTFSDISGNNITGTINNSPQLNYGFGRNFVFNGTNNTVSFARTRFTSGLTYAAWIKTTSSKNTATWTTTTANPIVGDTDNAVWNGFGVHNGKLRYCYYNRAGNAVLTFDSVTSVNSGSWVHVAVVHRSSDDQIFLYINGVLDYSASGLTAGANDPWANYIAANRIGCGYGSADFFNGSIAQVIIYNSSITASEILQLYSATRSRFDSFYSPPIISDGLILHLDANNQSSYPGSGTTWTDLSGQGNHHTITGSPTFSNDRFALNGSTQGFTKTSFMTGATNACTVVIWYSTSDTQELWVRGNQSNSYYLSAAEPNYISGAYYHNLVGSPTNYIDLNPVTAPTAYRNGNFHMWEAKNVDFSNWTYFEWFLYPSSWQMAGNVAAIFVYSRSLTAIESAQNFNALRRRFGL